MQLNVWLLGMIGPSSEVPLRPCPSGDRPAIAPSGSNVLKEVALTSIKSEAGLENSADPDAPRIFLRARSVGLRCRLGPNDDNTVRLCIRAITDLERADEW